MSVLIYRLDTRLMNRNGATSMSHEYVVVDGDYPLTTQWPNPFQFMTDERDIHIVYDTRDDDGYLIETVGEVRHPRCDPTNNDDMCIVWYRIVFQQYVSGADESLNPWHSLTTTGGQNAGW